MCYTINSSNMANNNDNSNLPTEPFRPKGKDDLMSNEQKDSGLYYNAGEYATVVQATELFDLRKSELTPFALRLAQDTATTVFMSEFRSRVLASKKRRLSNDGKMKTTVR